MRISHLSLIVVFSVLTAGCGPQLFWYKEGRTPQQAGEAELNCSVSAAQDIPASIQQVQEPGEYVKGVENCVETITNGVRTKSCVKTPGYWKDGPLTTYDANDSLRKRYFQNCMAKKGYQQIALKECENKGTLRATLQYPALKPGACYVNTANHQALIISP